MKTILRDDRYVTVVALSLSILLLLGHLAEAQTYQFESIPSERAGLGAHPIGTLITDGKGNVYGTTSQGVSYGRGTVFEVNRAGKATTLYTFPGGANGELPQAGLLRDKLGNLYGTTYNGGSGTCDCGVVFKIDSAGNETVLHSFQGMPDGDNPESSLVHDGTGNLYGTTVYGGTSSACGGDAECGTVFKIDSAGSETILHSFTGGSDGAYPSAGLLLDSAGNLYGTTSYGGTFSAGTVFKVDTSGTETVLYNFQGGSDGQAPVAPLVQDGAGNLYGTTERGGAACSLGCGTVFKLTLTGQETVLYRFTGGNDGSFPLAGLVADSAGNLYGTTTSAGDLSCSIFFDTGCGTVFKISSDGTETTLYTFNGSDGAMPESGLLRDAAGNLYGTTFDGGSGHCYSRSENLGCGVIFKLSQ